MGNKKLFLIIDQYYNKPLKIILEKLFNCDIYLLSSIKCDSNYNIPYYYNQRINAYKKGLDEGCNVLLNYNDDDIINVLKREKYNFKEYRVSNNIFYNYKVVKDINNKINIFSYIRYYFLIYIIILLINRMQYYIRENIGYEINKGSFDRIENSINNNLTSKLNAFSIIKKYFYYMKRLKMIYLDRPKNCFKIAIISNSYIINDLYYDYTIEKELSNKNIICDRYIGKKKLNWFINKYYLYKVRKYCKYNIGNNIIRNIYNVVSSKYDGLIFINSEGNIVDECTLIIVENICRNKEIPMININFNKDINNVYIGNNINMLYDLINIDKNKKIT